MSARNARHRLRPGLRYPARAFTGTSDLLVGKYEKYGTLLSFFFLARDPKGKMKDEASSVLGTRSLFLCILPASKDSGIWRGQTLILAGLRPKFPSLSRGKLICA